MSWTKRQYITQAFEEIGLASYIFDLQPEQLQSAARRLDVMMANWNGQGIRIGYPIAGDPDDIDLDTETNVPDSANQAIITNLAIQLAPGFGKVVSPETKRAAKDGYNTLAARGQAPGSKRMPKNFPQGAGHKPWRNNQRPFTPTPEDPLKAGTDSTIDFN
ncbi:hypothetical protein KAR91_01885 [Candidatus Pacearchaeota archaeon]|nr:hypothetical protein [Candidatus Pacearchaeota archaeon]